MNPAAGFLGAGLAFLLSSVLLSVFPAVFDSQKLLQFLYSLGMFHADIAFAGNFPDPILSAVGRVLFLLTLLSFILAALFFVLQRRKSHL